jgi:hypothetical protein
MKTYADPYLLNDITWERWGKKKGIFRFASVGYGVWKFCVYFKKNVTTIRELNQAVRSLQLELWARMDQIRMLEERIDMSTPGRQRVDSLVSELRQDGYDEWVPSEGGL